MAMFDPSTKRGSGDQQYGVPPGDYLIAMINFDRRMNKKQTAYYLRAKFKVIFGPAKGKSWTENISLDATNDATAFRLQLLFEGVGRNTAIDLDDESELRRALLHRPFKARLRRYTENGYTNNGIERYLVGKDVSDADRDVIDQYKLDREASGADDEVHGGGQFEDAPHPATDDEIPFVTSVDSCDRVSAYVAKVLR